MSIASRQRQQVRDQQLGRSKIQTYRKPTDPADNVPPDFHVSDLQHVAHTQTARAAKKDVHYKAGLRGAFALNGLTKSEKTKRRMVRAAMSEQANAAVKKELSVEKKETAS